jgi:predicted acetyltransferase
MTMSAYAFVLANRIGLEEITSSPRLLEGRGGDGIALVPKHGFELPSGPRGCLFTIVGDDGTEIGSATAIIERDSRLVEDVGHVGVEIAQDFQGRGYPARAVRALLPLFRDYDVGELLLVVDAGNAAVERGCAAVGAAYIDSTTPGSPGAGKARYRITL